jgi:hypothetical protein
LPVNNPLASGEIRNEGESGPLAFRKDIGLGISMHETILILNARESRTALSSGALRFTQLLHRDVRAADLSYLARANELIERAEGVGDGGTRVR